MKLAEQLADESNSNWDEATQKQEKAIEDEIAANQPMISEKLAVLDMQSDYTEPENAVYQMKAKKLAKIYKHMRRVRGDGCCFYRALAFAQCERIIDNAEVRENFKKNIAQFKDRLLKLGYPEMTTEDFCDVFCENVSEFKTREEVIDAFNDQGRSNYLVVFMRLVTCCHLQENEDKYGGFIEAPDMRSYCKDEVEPMTKECDHLCITALTEALNIPLRIEYMDQTTSPGNGSHHDFGLNESITDPEIFFLYRPGHYDILYRDM